MIPSKPHFKKPKSKAPTFRHISEVIDVVLEDIKNNNVKDNIKYNVIRKDEHEG